MPLVKQTFTALVAVYMLAEHIDDEKLLLTLEGMPRLPQWQDVRAVLVREIQRRQEARVPARAAEASQEDAA